MANLLSHILTDKRKVGALIIVELARGGTGGADISNDIFTRIELENRSRTFRLEVQHASH